MSPVAQLSWKPVHRGAVFCAPACGFGCKRSRYELAVKKAVALAKRLGPGFEADVWENGDWYWKVTYGAIDIRQRDDRTYDLTYGNQSWVKSARSPKAGLEELLMEYKLRMQAERDAVAEIQGALGLA
jgi:hypothetical protein